MNIQRHRLSIVIMNNPNPHQPWTLAAEEIVRSLEVSIEKGLDTREAKNRKRTTGPNRIEQRRRKPAWGILLDQFKNLIVLLLGAAAVLSFSFGQWLEGLSITAVVFINAAIGFVTELKAVRSMEALKQMSRVHARVLRDGSVKEIAAEDLVPGDLVEIEGGDIVSADIRILEASRLQADESALTGESVPVNKDTKMLEGDIPLAEHKNMLFKGTFVTRGSGRGVVTATGMKTELGKIAAMTEEAETEHTPLEKRLDRLASRLIWITLGIAVFVSVSGIIAGKELLVIIETSIALAVAAIPEGLPIVATIALARGMWRMASHNALMNRLSAVETLGATDIICSDKTGTLTENRMTVSLIALPIEGIRQITLQENGDEGEGFYVDDRRVDAERNDVLRYALEIGVLCSNARLPKESSDSDETDTSQAVNNALGDPMEVALLAVGAKAGIYRDSLHGAMPEEREEAFDPENMMMATFHRRDGNYRVAVKGAPEAVLDASDRVRTKENGSKQMSDTDLRAWQDCNQEMAEAGLRVLAVAEKTADTVDAEPYKDLIFTGLLGMIDPPRGDVKEAVDACQSAGIRVIMVTGDHPVTAKHTGASLGIDDEDAIEGKALKPLTKLSDKNRRRLLKAGIFARVSPEQKLNLIELHQENGSIVAMTGDGVNDAPALKKADIGISMGKRGTQVAREASDMVLKDDAFKTIVLAVAQGRAIFDNIRKFILFLLSGNMGEIMIVAFALLSGAPLPLLPLQILYLNMIGDVFPALALGVGKEAPAEMNRPPRDPKEPVLTRNHWLAIVGYGLLIALPVLGSFAVALKVLKLGPTAAVTVSFLTLAFARLWHVFNMRDSRSGLFRNEIVHNPFIWTALALCTTLLVAATYAPGLSGILHMVPPGRVGWLVIIGTSLIPLVIGQVLISSRRLIIRTNGN